MFVWTLQNDVMLLSDPPRMHYFRIVDIFEESEQRKLRRVSVEEILSAQFSEIFIFVCFFVEILSFC